MHAIGVAALGGFALVAGLAGGRADPGGPGRTRTVSRRELCASCMLDAIGQRLAVRRFLPTAVPEAHVRRILDAAQGAPSSPESGHWRFLVVRDRAKLDRLKTEAVKWYAADRARAALPGWEVGAAEAREAFRAYMDSALSAPVYVAVLVDRLASNPESVARDGALAAGMLMVAAHSLGYGTGSVAYLHEDGVRSLLGVPDRYRLICFTSIGVPAASPGGRTPFDPRGATAPGAPPAGPGAK